ncbi:LysR family transcriptional regulator [Rhizobium sullae]|uniref:LysR family transcriptional regulator n=1 Tax=Rhizobium sullae TaxID=50338 RepID=A0A4R3PQ44_RHISU|nr:LysR family transcriptional regulator [Rhizobium sullae]TCU02118.1 LysR family transcriptional regulator [Rhizobium sullae]
MTDPIAKLTWDDLRIIRAVGKNGALAPAAEMLGVNSSTIARRLSKVEGTLGVTLFDRRRTGYVTTAQGEELIALAERVELDVVSVARRVSGHVQGHTGDLRITTSDSLLLHFLTPMSADFQSYHPAIKLEVIVGNSPLNLARGESDIAIRATETPPENLFGRKVANIAWAPYLSRSDSSLSSSGMDALRDRQWVSYSGKLSGLKAFKFVEERVNHDDIIYRTDSVAGAAAAIVAGLGVGFLPCMLGDLSPDLVRVGAVEPQLNDELWLLTHPDIRKSGRIYAFMTHCIEAIGKRRDLVEGRLGTTSGQPSEADINSTSLLFQTTLLWGRSRS